MSRGCPDDRGPKTGAVGRGREYNRGAMAMVPGSRVRRPRLGRKSQLGVVDYTLAKRALLRAIRTGLLSPLEVCDAHPELMRAAKHVGEPSRRDCPICRDGGELRLLAYVYGDDLKQDNGRVWSLATGLRMAASHRGACCYVVEVCTSCSWNHLSEAFTARTAG